MQKKDLTPGAEVLAKLTTLSKALEQEPPEQCDRLGIDNREVHAAHDVIIRQIERFCGIRVHNVRSRDGRLQIEGLETAGPEPALVPPKGPLPRGIAPRSAASTIATA